MYEIISKQKLNNDVDQMVIHAPLVAKNARAGHFVILRVNDDGERIPLTITDVDGDNVTIIYQKLGYSTKLLSTKNVGDFISDFVGPLGKAAQIRDVDRVLAIAGGVGAAPLYPQIKEYYRKGVKVDLILGGRTKNHLLLVDEYNKLCENVYLCTDDGSTGVKGFVTQVQEILLTKNKYDHSIAIGPLVMMKNCVTVNNNYNLKTDVSLNPIMIDGTGMCGNCRVSINNMTYFACVDGPDFPAEGIEWGELMARQDYYKNEETHICKLEVKTNEIT